MGAETRKWVQRKEDRCRYKILYFGATVDMTHLQGSVSQNVDIRFCLSFHLILCKRKRHKSFPFLV